MQNLNESKVYELRVIVMSLPKKCSRLHIVINGFGGKYVIAYSRARSEFFK